MFLDSNNCYYIDGVGLFVFWPEIGQVFFYKEKKKDKTLTFTVDALDFDNNEIIYTTQLSEKRFIGKILGVASVKLFFKSQNTNNLFTQFYEDERSKKFELMTSRHQVDYLLVLKYSQKYDKKDKIIHISKEEPRIIRIDWGNKQIKYYGDESILNINDYLVPKEFPVGKVFPVNALESIILNPSNTHCRFNN